MFPPKPQQPPSLLAALLGTAVNAGSNALEGYARKQQVEQAGPSSGPGCTPCAAMARRRRAAAHVSSLGGGRKR